MWLRYIDDHLMIRGGTPQELIQFIDELNTNDRNIKLTFSFHSQTLPFLDPTIGVENGRITTKTYRKQRAANTLLQATSHHPRSFIQGIPVGQFLRIKLNCSQEHDFGVEARELYSRFRERGYSHHCIRKAKKKVMQVDRQVLLDKNLGPKFLSQSQAPIRIITKCGTQWDQVKNILNHHWHILADSPILGEIVDDRPLLTARRSRNLKDSLTHSEYQRSVAPNWLSELPPLRGMYPCGSLQVCGQDRCVHQL